MASSWKSMFVPAVEPPAGWPTRPWDHRHLEDEGSIVRVAVDQSGTVVLDADGDEVQSGPGFDYEVAKVRRGSPKPEHDTPVVPGERLAPEMLELLGRAERMGAVFGHCWVGTEHLGLALVEQSSPARDIIGSSWETVAGAVAEFYEGPYATARLALVAERLSGGWEPVPVREEATPVPNWSLRQLFQLSVAAAEAEGRRRAGAVDVAGQLVAPGQWSLVGRLLARHRRR